MYGGPEVQINVTNHSMQKHCKIKKTILKSKMKIKKKNSITFRKTKYQKPNRNNKKVVISKKKKRQLRLSDHLIKETP